MGKQGADFMKMLGAASEALSGETKFIDENGEEWLFIGGVKPGQQLFVKDPSGVPMVGVTIRMTKEVPTDLHQAVYRVLIKRGPEGELLRLAIDFTNPLEYSNQPIDLSGLLGKT